MSLRAWLTEKFLPATNKPLGERGEDAAARHLKRKGYRIVARHVASRLGELDVVALDGRTIVFVEVKTRATSDAGHPSEAIDLRKQQRMTQAALAFLKARGLLNHTARFDVMAITWAENERRPTIEHFENAFSPVGSGQFFS
jgi:putative endonuclease